MLAPSSWPALIHSSPLSSQVACPYVGCGESFADHSTIHAQVRVVAGSTALQSDSAEFKPQLQLPPSSIHLLWVSVSMSVK